MLKKMTIFVTFLFTIPLMANNKTAQKTSIRVDISRADLNADDEEPDDFDAEYEHDEEYIRVKSEELRQTVFNDYEAIDNIILYEALMTSYNEWKGTKYRLGGDSKSGIDCSALTRRIYRDVFNDYELPRVSVDQVKRGIRVKDSELKPGDILYFRPRNSVNHVGVYLGNSLFINASSSRGVILSSLDNSYWKKYYKYGVRIDKAREQ